MTSTAPELTEVAMSEGSSPAPRREMVRRTLRDSAYLLVSWPVLIVAFSVVISLLATSVGLAIVWVGIPLLLVTFGAARAFVLAECWLQRTLLDATPAPGAYLPRRPGEALWKSALRLVVDPQSWIDVLFSLFAWVVALVTWSLTVTWWSTALIGLASPVLHAFLPDNVAGIGSLLTAQSPGVRTAVDLATGLLALGTLPWVTRGLASVQSALFGAVLAARGLRAQVTHLEASRTAARDAEAASLRKLERDLHDGPQQRLVRLQMDLGRALHQVDADPAKARVAMESSLTQAQQTLDELRNLSRGIAPPILVDRGLVAALDELTARSAIPVRFVTNLPRDRRPDEIPARVQDAAFYVVSEALTNAAKHSGAERAEVEVHLGEQMLRVTVRDEGRGGATYDGSGGPLDRTGGTGLLGLRDRLAGLDGMLDLYSPAGGPTVLTAILPCG
jgi:signal transduction histidine kinase